MGLATYNKITKLLIKHRGLVDAEAFDHSRVLHAAVKAGDILVLTMFLDISGFSNIKDVYRASALHYAAVSGSLQMVNSLLSRRLFPVSGLDDQSDIYGSALYAAIVNICQKNDMSIKIPELLLDAGVDVNITGYYSQPLLTPLMVAILYSSVKLAELLLQRGTNIWIRRERFLSVGHLDLTLRNQDILDLLDRYRGHRPHPYSTAPLKLLTYPGYEENSDEEDAGSAISDRTETYSWSTITSSPSVYKILNRHRRPPFRTVRFKNAVFRYKLPHRRHIFSKRVVAETMKAEQAVDTREEMMRRLSATSLWLPNSTSAQLSSSSQTNRLPGFSSAVTAPPLR